VVPEVNKTRLGRVGAMAMPLSISTWEMEIALHLIVMGMMVTFPLSGWECWISVARFRHCDAVRMEDELHLCSRWWAFSGNTDVAG
jgi:hypothetical protein